MFTREKGAWKQSPALRSAIGRVARANGMNPDNFCEIDNSCPMAALDVARSSSSRTGDSDKLTWRDVAELAEWIRPGTLRKNDAFDPNKM